GRGRPAHLPPALRPRGRRDAVTRRRGGRGGGGGRRRGPRHRRRHGGGRRGDRGRGRGRGDGGEGGRDACARRAPPGRLGAPARRARTVATAVADRPGGAGHPALPGPAAGPGRLDGPQEGGAAAARRGQERGGPRTQRAGAVVRAAAGTGGRVRGP